MLRYSTLIWARNAWTGTDSIQSEGIGEDVASASTRCARQSLLPTLKPAAAVVAMRWFARFDGAALMR